MVSKGCLPDALPCRHQRALGFPGSPIPGALWLAKLSLWEEQLSWRGLGTRRGRDRWPRHFLLQRKSSQDSGRPSPRTPTAWGALGFHCIKLWASLSCKVCV